MVYVDTSVILSELLSEDRRPDPSLWNETLISSRLLEYEVWCRLHVYRAAKSHGETARTLLSGVTLIELSPLVLQRALEPFPLPVRTLDALHLASLEYVRATRQKVLLATFDTKLASLARKMGIPLF